MALAGIKKLLGGFMVVRREEWPQLLPLTLAYGLLMASLYVLKPARNALFLEGAGIAQLPYVLLLVALIGGLVAIFFTRFVARVRLDRLILSTFLVLIACLGGFWLLLQQGWTWSFYLFYIWVNLCSLMAPSLLWLLANALFNAREARRLFGVINAVGILGVILGSVFTGWIVGLVGTENLLLICMVLLAGCLGLLYLVNPGETRPRRQRESAEGALRLIARSDLLRLVGGMAGLTAVVAAVVDVQFNEIVDRNFTSTDEKTAFFGQFFAYLNLGALFFQLIITPRILRSMGVTSALLFLPLSMAMGSLAVLLVPGLAAGILVKVGDGGFRHSIHKSAVEILSLPVPTEVKQRTKVLLDTTVDNMATGLGALLVLVLIGAGAAYQHLSLLSLGLIALWVVLVLHGRGAYVGAFRQALEERMIDVGEFTVDITEASTIDSLVGSLASDNERHVVYALDMLASTRAGRLIEPVRQLLRHNSIEVRQKALLILQNQEDGVPLAEVEELLQDDNLEVRIEALYYLCLKGEGERLQRLQEALRSPDRKLRTAAVGCIAGYGTAAENDLVDAGFIQGLYADSDEEGMSAAERVGERIQAAKLLGNLERPGMRPYLRQFMRQLMEDPEPEVVQQTIISLGQLGDLEHVPWLLDKLAQRNYRMVSRQALAAYGTGVLEPLGRYLVDEHMELMVRGHIPRVLSSIVEQDSVDLLISSFAQVDPMLEYALIKALSKLRGQNPGLGFDEVWVDAVLQEEIKSCYAMLQALQVYQNADDTTAVQLLKKALREKQEQNVERTFRLLGLQYAPQDMYNAYLGFVSGQRATRASAIEFLDNVLRWKIKEQLIPLLDPLSPDSAIPQGEQLFGFSMSSRKEVLEYLLASRDAWLRTCAVYSVAEENAAAQVELLREAQDDPHPVVRETAALVLRGATS